MDGMGRGVAGMSGWRGGHIATESNEAIWRAKHRNIGNVLRDALRFIRLCFLNSTIFFPPARVSCSDGYICTCCTVARPQAGKQCTRNYQPTHEHQKRAALAALVPVHYPKAGGARWLKK
jgi:hypothetical protein